MLLDLSPRDEWRRFFLPRDQDSVEIFIAVITLERVVRRGYYVSLSLGYINVFRVALLHRFVVRRVLLVVLKIGRCFILLSFYPLYTQKVLYQELHTVNIYRRATRVSDTC